MKRNELIQIAHDALQDVNLYAVQTLINAVNLAPLERIVIVKSELEHERLGEISEKVNLSIDSVMRIKTSGMKKIAMFIQRL